ncbi:hypothetical protein HQ545_04480 [Candidatus Woesearchaeota archaeon]|nr:hypothetical protein [Candidatus Woesearchaeota archaeon]
MSGFRERMLSIDESMREISALDELYEDIVNAGVDSNEDIIVRKEEAKFAKERMLKLSLHVKHMLEGLEQIS